MKYLWMILGSISLFIGLWYLAYSINFVYSYFINAINPSRNEYLQGAVLAGMISLPFWIAATCFMLPIKEHVPIIIYRIIIGLTVGLSALFAIFMAASLIMFAFDKLSS